MAEPEPNVAGPNVTQLAGVIDDNPDPDEAAAAKAAAEAAATEKDIWPEKWREEIAGADDKDGKRLARLGRFDHMGKVFDSLLESEKMYQQADIRSAFPDEASDKDKAKWRKNNGVPAEAAGYFEKLPEGIKIAEEDKQGMDTLAQAMHAVHAPPGTTHAAMGAWYNHVDNVLADRAERDKKNERDHGDQLDEGYGRDSRGTANRLSDLYNGAGEGVMDAVLDARMANDMKVRDFFDFTKFMAETLYKANPLRTVPGLGGGDPAAALDDEIAGIEKTMQTDFKVYNADKVMKDRYLVLLEARDKRK